MHTLDELIGYSITDGFKLAYNAIKVKADIAALSGGFCQYDSYAQDWARLSSFVEDNFIGSPMYRSISFPFSYVYMQYWNGADPYYSQGYPLTRSSTNQLNPAALLMRAVYGVTAQYSMPSKQDNISSSKGDVSRTSLSHMWNECYPGTSPITITSAHYDFNYANERYLDITKYYPNVICDALNYMDACSAVIKVKNVWDPPNEGGAWRFYAEVIQ